MVLLGNNRYVVLPTGLALDGAFFFFFLPLFWKPPLPKAKKSLNKLYSRISFSARLLLSLSLSEGYNGAGTKQQLFQVPFYFIYSVQGISLTVCVSTKDKKKNPP
jgi:hypothetical protein